MRGPFLYCVPVVMAIDNPARKVRARFKARVYPWIDPVTRLVDKDRLPRGAVWVEFVASDEAAARVKIAEVIGPGDPRPVRSAHLVGRFRHSLTKERRCVEG